jgi:hypothetical protein
MIVVMPAGHVNGAGAALGGQVPAAAANGMPGIGSGPDPFANDFMTDLLPYIEKNYRVLTDRPNRAIAGAILPVHAQGLPDEAAGSRGGPRNVSPVPPW